MIIKKDIQNFVLPLIATHFLQLIIAQLSLIISSRDSIEYLGGINTIQSLFFALGGILGAFNYGFNIKGAKAIGNNDKKEYYRLLGSSIKLDLIIGLAFSVIVLFMGKLLLNGIYGFNGEMLNITFLFLSISSPYILLTLLMFTLGNAIKIEKKTGWILKVSVLTSILQVLLNIVFIKMLHFGVIGAGLSSMISLSTLVFVYAMLVKELLRSIVWREATRVISLIKFGFPLMIQEIFEGVLFIIVFESLIARLGMNILAIYAVAAQLFSIAKMPTFMYAQGITVFYTGALGARSVKKAKEIFKLCLKFSMLFYLSFSILLLFFAKPISMIFSTEKVVIEQAPAFILIVLVTMIFSPIYEISKYALQSNGKEKYVLKMTATLNIIFLSAMLLLRTNGFIGFNGLYALNGMNILVLGIIYLLTNIRLLKMMSQ